MNRTYAPDMDSLGEDLLLLSIKPQSGRIATIPRLKYGLMGSELVRLAARGKIEISGDRIVVRDPSITGDSELDAALDSLNRSRRPQRPRRWVASPRPRITDAYLGKLATAGAVRSERALLLTRWTVVAAVAASI